MGTETMGSNGICGGGARKPFDELSRQGSLYNLTLDEVQRQLGDLGKPLSSMNLDELLNSVWVAEANQGQLTPTLPRQLSHKLSTDLTKKTVNEVWQDIQQGQIQKKKISDSRKASHERQPTLGEMTLEDFLVKAGIVAESSPSKKIQASAMVVAQPQQNHDPQEAQWMQYPIQQHVLMPGHYQVPVPANVVMDAGYPETQMTMSPTPLIGTLSDTHSIGRKRFASGDVIEKTVERRQKRMIKNRESAARSRERKQAYTHELENKVSRLEEENERLRRHKEEAAKVLACVAPPNPKYQLRRTTSAPF